MKLGTFHEWYREGLVYVYSNQTKIALRYWCECGWSVSAYQEQPQNVEAAFQGHASTCVHAKKNAAKMVVWESSGQWDEMPLPESILNKALAYEPKSRRE